MDMKRIQERVSQNKDKLPAGIKKIVNDADFHEVFLKASKLTKNAA